MSTLRQKKLAKAIVNNVNAIEPQNKQELLVSAGYDMTTAEANPGKIIDQKGVQKELLNLGFDEESAKKVVVNLLQDSKDDSVKLRAAGEIFKVMGTYAAEKTFNLNATASVEDLKSVIQKDLERFRPN